MVIGPNSSAVIFCNQDCTSMTRALEWGSLLNTSVHSPIGINAVLLNQDQRQDEFWWRMLNQFFTTYSLILCVIKKNSALLVKTHSVVFISFVQYTWYAKGKYCGEFSFHVLHSQWVKQHVGLNYFHGKSDKIESTTTFVVDFPEYRGNNSDSLDFLQFLFQTCSLQKHTRRICALPKGAKLPDVAVLFTRHDG